MALSWFIPFGYLSGLWRMLFFPLSKDTYENIDPAMLYLFGIILVLGISAVGAMYPTFAISVTRPRAYLSVWSS